MIIPHTQHNKFLLPRVIKLFLQGKWDVNTKSAIDILISLSSHDQWEDNSQLLLYYYK